MAPKCLADNAENPWRCWLPPVAEKYVDAPLFFWQSKFDHFQLSEFVGLECARAQAYTPPWHYNLSACSLRDTVAIEAYGNLFLEQFGPVLATPGTHRAVFLTSCVLHGMSQMFLSVMGTTPSIAITLWHMALRDSNPPILDNDFKWIESLTLPRVDNPLACPPFTFTPPF